MSLAAVARPAPNTRRSFDRLTVESFANRAEMGAAAASDVASALKERLSSQPGVRMIFAAAPSQADMLRSLCAEPGIDWSRVTAFHMDEYIGLDPASSARFANWLDINVFNRLPFAAVHRITPEPDAELAARRYADLLNEAPIDFVCLGIGVNGHIAFNDPPVADFADPLDVKVVELDEICRQQQVDDDCFADLASVPHRAITLTVPRLMRADRLFCIVPGAVKRDAVERTLHGPRTTQCPASILREHADCTLYLDKESDPDACTIIDADALCEGYLEATQALMRRVIAEEKTPLDQAASRLADQIAADRLVHIYGPGGHSNLASQEVFFRAGGLMHVSAILDEGTLLSNGALRSMAIERTPGYGKIVIANQRLGAGDVLILVNAYGINSALIDAAMEARQRGVFLIGVSSREHAANTAPDHPARHPTKQNLHDVVDIAIDCKVPIGDAVVSVPGMGENIAAISTFANAFTLNSLVIRTVAKLVERGIEPPVWRSGNAPGGDEANRRFIDGFQGRVKAL